MLRRRVLYAAIPLIAVVGLLVWWRFFQPRPGEEPYSRLRYVGSLVGSGAGELNGPLDVTADRQGRIYVADAGSNSLKVFNQKGRLLVSLGGEGRFVYPNAVAVGPDGHVFVGEFRAKRIQVLDRAQQKALVIDEKVAGEPLEPLDLAVGEDGRIYVADRRGAVLILGADGKIRRKVQKVEAKPSDLSFPNGIAVDAAGNILVADSGHRRLLLLNPEGKVIRQFSHAELNYPRGVGFAAGGRMVVADTLGNQVVLLGPEFQVLDAEGALGGTIFPNGLAVRDNMAYVADRANNRVLVFRLE